MSWVVQTQPGASLYFQSKRLVAKYDWKTKVLSYYKRNVVLEFGKAIDCFVVIEAYPLAAAEMLAAVSIVRIFDLSTGEIWETTGENARVISSTVSSALLGIVKAWWTVTPPFQKDLPYGLCEGGDKCLPNPGKEPFTADMSQVPR